MMTSRSLICLLENQNGGKLQKSLFDIVRVHRKVKFFDIACRKVGYHR
jgi:hypothetical protein